MTGSHKNNVTLSAFLSVISLFVEHSVPECCYLMQFYCLPVCHSVLHSHKTFLKANNGVKYMGLGICVYVMSIPSLVVRANLSFYNEFK